MLFLPDHPLTGGYPIIGALTDRCLDLAGQLPPGARIRFRIVDPGEPGRCPSASASRAASDDDTPHSSPFPEAVPTEKSPS